MKTKADVTVDFDHHTNINVIHPDDAYAKLRREHPIAWSSKHGGYWILTRYADVETVLRDYRNFSSKDGMAIPSHPVDYSIPVALDPPEHSAYRRAMNPKMTKEAVQTLIPRIQHWVHEYIDNVIEMGACDLMYDIAVPVPCAVTLEWVGWDRRDEWDRIAEAWHGLVSYPLGEPESDKAHADLRWFVERVGEELAKRRDRPQDDVLTYITQLDIDGKPIGEHEAISMATVWVAGGVDTTTSALAGAIVHLDGHPGDRRRLLDDPSDWESATDEFLRRYPPTRTTTRTVMNPVEVGGLQMEPGDRILVVMSSANHDEAVWENPLEFDVGRVDNKHLSFGFGVHRCVGMHLARQEMQVILRAILERMPDYRLDQSRLRLYERQSEMQGAIAAPATFTPGIRRAVLA